MFRQISQGIFGEYTLLIKKKTKGRTGNGISEYCNGTNFAGSPGILANVTGVPAKTRVSKSTMLCFRGNIYMRHAQIFEETERRVAKESSAVKASRYLKDFSKISHPRWQKFSFFYRAAEGRTLHRTRGKRTTVGRFFARFLS